MKPNNKPNRTPEDLTLTCRTDPESCYIEATALGPYINLDVVDGEENALIDLSAQDAIALANWLVKATIQLNPDAVGPGPLERVPPEPVATPTPLFQLYLARLAEGQGRCDALRHAKKDLEHFMTEVKKDV